MQYVRAVYVRAVYVRAVYVRAVMTTTQLKNNNKITTETTT